MTDDIFNLIGEANWVSWAQISVAIVLDQCRSTRSIGANDNEPRCHCFKIYVAEGFCRAWV
jgi:hypothetical protein